MEPENSDQEPSRSIHASEHNFADEEGFKDFMGPGQIDQMIREAMSFCWLSLPKSKRSVDVVEQRMKKLLDRIIEGWREDEQFRSGG